MRLTWCELSPQDQQSGPRRPSRVAGERSPQPGSSMSRTNSSRVVTCGTVPNVRPRQLRATPADGAAARLIECTIAARPYPGRDAPPHARLVCARQHCARRIGRACALTGVSALHGETRTNFGSTDGGDQCFDSDSIHTVGVGPGPATESQLHRTHRPARPAASAAQPRRSHRSPAACPPGPRGVGKTQLAVEYAYRESENYRGRLVDPRRSTGAGQSLARRLAPRLGLTGIPRDRQEDAVAAVIDALRRGDPYSRWLLIFDNADQPESIREFFPAGQPHGHVLVTSRNRRWLGEAETVEVDVFSRPESLEFLQRRVTGIEDKDAGLAGGGTGRPAVGARTGRRPSVRDRHVRRRVPRPRWRRPRRGSWPRTRRRTIRYRSRPHGTCPCPSCRARCPSHWSSFVAAPSSGRSRSPANCSSTARER